MEQPCHGCHKKALIRQMRLIETLKKAYDYAAENKTNVEIFEEPNDTFAFFEEGHPATAGREALDRISKYQ